VHGAPATSGGDDGSGSGPCPNISCKTRAAFAPRHRARRRFRSFAGSVRPGPASRSLRVICEFVPAVSHQPAQVVVLESRQPCGSLLTPRWREMDSNSRSPSRKKVCWGCRKEWRNDELGGVIKRRSSRETPVFGRGHLPTAVSFEAGPTVRIRLPPPASLLRTSAVLASQRQALGASFAPAEHQPVSAGAR
jgi:hypothetical protein